MSYKKITLITCLGHLLITVPIFVGALFWYNISGFDSIGTSLIWFSMSWLYWSYGVTLYKYYSIKNIDSKVDYYAWNNVSILTGIYWPDNFFLTFTEFWFKRQYDEYTNKVKSLIS